MSTTTLELESVSYVCTLVRERSAIELEPSKAYLIEARLQPIAKRHGFASTGELIRSLQLQPKRELQAHVVEAMTTNETSFFRDRNPFDAMVSPILPELFKSRAAIQTINIWSAACSTGQEAYSIAMLIRDNFAAQANWKWNILGTDLSDEVLEKARAAKYSQIEMNRGLPAPMLVKHFSREGMHWELKPELKRMASFRKLNLIEPLPVLPTMDVVFLRNVLIYFAPEVKRMILGKIRKAMASDGILFLGAAETTIGLDASFERVQSGNSVYYRPK